MDNMDTMDDNTCSLPAHAVRLQDSACFPAVLRAYSPQRHMTT
ncbi:MAG: hypothetical protein ACOX9E_15865 [Lentisphaeria bacterium]